MERDMEAEQLLSRAQKVRLAKESFYAATGRDHSYRTLEGQNREEEKLTGHSEKYRRSCLILRIVCAIFLFSLFVLARKNQWAYHDLSVTTVQNCMQDEKYVTEIEDKMEIVIQEIKKWGFL